VLLLGASGSGKSTLLRALAGVLAPDEGEQQGELRVDGQPGLVLQDPDSQVILAKVGDDVAFGCENLGVPREQIWPRVRAALDAVGLDVPLERSTAALSGGQRQRLALAGVLAMQPGLLLLDEPTANLDPTGVTEVVDATRAVLDATGATLVVVEHRVATWLPLVERVVVLGPEGVVADGSPGEVLTERGAELAAQGIWVPGHPPARPQRLTSPGATLLSAHELTVGREGVAVRSGLDVTVRAGALLAVTGPNGAGKSTLGLTLAGLLPPVDGEVRASDALADGAGPHPIRWTSRQLLTRIGTVFQDPEHQFLARTVREELEIGPRALQRDGNVDELLQRLRLTHLARANPFTLSGGEQRRLSVATALATRPRVLVLDEPTFGQDAATWAELVALIAELLQSGTAMVAATHDADFVDALADATLVLS
jgi:energy-coupling factor transport system ATP-binding protein